MRRLKGYIKDLISKDYNELSSGDIANIKDLLEIIVEGIEEGDKIWGKDVYLYLTEEERGDEYR